MNISYDTYHKSLKMGCIWSKQRVDSSQSNYDYITVPSSPPPPDYYFQPNFTATTLLSPTYNTSSDDYYSQLLPPYFPSSQLQYPVTYYYVPEPTNISPIDSN